MPSDTGTTGGASAQSPAARDRVFLVVVDDSPERAVALKYACLRARKRVTAAPAGRDEAPFRVS